MARRVLRRITSTGEMWHGTAAKTRAASGGAKAVRIRSTGRKNATDTPRQTKRARHARRKGH